MPRLRMPMRAHRELTSPKNATKESPRAFPFLRRRILFYARAANPNAPAQNFQLARRWFFVKIVRILFVRVV